MSDCPDYLNYMDESSVANEFVERKNQIKLFAISRSSEDETIKSDERPKALLIAEEEPKSSVPEEVKQEVSFEGQKEE